MWSWLAVRITVVRIYKAIRTFQPLYKVSIALYKLDNQGHNLLLIVRDY